jgi:o-succinylbenzoate---CoA ligase
MSILDFLGTDKVNPESVAIIEKDKEITFNDLNSSVNKAAFFLKTKGIKENDIITLLLNNSSEFIITILALWKIGAVPAPLNIKLRTEDLTEQFKFLNSNFITKSEEFADVSLTGENFVIPFDNLPESSEEIPIPNFSKDKTALILFTSGTSGKPKAVMLSFDNLIQSALIGDKVLNYTQEDKWLASLPFYHIGGFSIIFRAIMFGLPVIIPASLSNDDLREAINKYKPALTSLVSNQLKKFIDINFIPPKELRNVLLGGGFSDNNLVLKAIEMGWKVAKVYGSTETSSFISFMNYEEVKIKPGASGKALQPNKISTTGEGEILVQSPAVMTGYYNNNEETSAKIKNGLYNTGDFGYLDDEGYLFIEAKREDLIVSGGENINPAEVEKVILTHPYINEVCVIGIEDEKWGQAVYAAVVPKENMKFSENDLINYLKDKISGYKIPKKIISIDQLPKNELGKVLKDKLRNFF